MSVSAEVLRRPVLSLPRELDPELSRLLEGAVLTAAASSGVVGLSLVAGRHQVAVAVAGAVGHVTVSGVLAARAFVQHVREDLRAQWVGVLAALTTLGVLMSATHLAGPAL
jgi:hypothetical protein